MVVFLAEFSRLPFVLLHMACSCHPYITESTDSVILAQCMASTDAPTGTVDLSELPVQFNVEIPCVP